MANANPYFKNLSESYLFTEISRKVGDFEKDHPNMRVLRLGIGDVTLPLPGSAILAMQHAAKEMGQRETFRGYGPEQGYAFLREAIQQYYQSHAQVDLALDEIFISDGAKSDVGNITDLFSKENVVLIPDPVYPVYVDTNVMNDRQIRYVDANDANHFLPSPPDFHADLIYLCSPNNPTGAVYNREQLKVWVDYALENKAIILFDAAYECFIGEPNLPHSIFEIEGARRCAIEFCSLSKTAGFTGVRCGYTVIPKELGEKEGISYNKLWLRRQTTKFNGVPYIIQRGAEAVFTPEGMAECKENISYYMENAHILSETFRNLEIPFIGGKNAPYVWVTCPNHMNSWDFFDMLLSETGIVGTPGVGFGKNGENHFRFSSFGKREDVSEASRLFKDLFSK